MPYEQPARLPAAIDHPANKVIQNNGYQTVMGSDGKTRFVLPNGDTFCLEDDDLDLDGVLQAWTRDPSYATYM
ncbi:hypothetical protein pdul_cds_683 [Pandoravirus dulcis]|uniref:Uncharacterized protein n=1 Tax=Pandoravirus dulcis TaxID=1349409 RepID=S4VY63_9VIRU|nr:hypothetical protein pdul_cds_683 [Pandoravirus dulcis]AGO82834.1 hypothetical protein pdul_cds_683 [Pandoravirus dulcis]